MSVLQRTFLIPNFLFGISQTETRATDHECLADESQWGNKEDTHHLSILSRYLLIGDSGLMTFFLSTWQNFW